MGLDVVENSAAAGPVQPNRGESRRRASYSPCKLDSHVAQHAARALRIRIRAAVGRPLGGQHTRRHALQAGHRGAAQDAQPAPAAGLAPSHGHRAGQHHGGLAGPLGDDPAARLDNDRGVAPPSLDERARLDGEGGAVADEQLVSQVVDSVAAQGEVVADLAVETATVEQQGAFSDGELGPGPAGPGGLLGLVKRLFRLPGAQLHHELPQAGLGGLTLPRQNPVGGGKGPRRGKLRRHPYVVDRFGVQLAGGSQRSEVTPLAASGLL